MSLRGLRRWWRSLASASPYEEPELVSLDLETSSLDPATASILSIAAVPVRGRRIVLSERYECVVRGAAPVDREAVKYHRLRPMDVEHGRPPEEAAAEFMAWLGERPLLGYCIGFDCTMLEKALSRSGSLLDGRRYDLRELYRRRVLQRSPDDAPSLVLDDILGALGVPVAGRHTALGDATAVAMAFLGLKFGPSSTGRPARRGAAAARG